MTTAALVTWLLAAGGGSLMAGIWLAKGGLRKPRTSAFQPAVLFGHAGLATLGLLLYVWFFISDEAGFAWLALLVVVPAAALGAALFFRWLPANPAAAEAAPNAGSPESHIPMTLALLHGVGALATVVLVLLVAFQA